MKLKILVILLACLVSKSAEAKNVIFFVGDGMGTAAVTAARLYSDAKDNRGLYLDGIPLVAHVRTQSHNRMVTDSAAAATAMATGIKTDNSCIGFGPNCDENLRLETIAEEATQRGMSVGLVTTTRITHATPAAFYAHVTDRNDETSIAEQLISSGVGVAFGGGCKYFTEEKSAKGGFVLIGDLKVLENIPENKKILGCFASSHIPYVINRREEGYAGPSLVQMTEAAIKRLSKNPKGFFLMVEGGRIDHAEHDNLARELLEEVLEFDDAVKKGASMTRPKDTLILVTADHETGGLALNGYAKLGSNILGEAGTDKKGRPYPIMVWATGTRSPYSMTVDPDDPSSLEAAHTAVDVPLYAIGMRKEIHRGTIDNTEIYGIMFDALFNK